MTLLFEQQLGPAGPIDDPVLLLDEYITIGNGAVFQSPIIDMRAFNSYHLAIELGNGTFNATDMANVAIYHFDKGDQGPSEPNVWADQWFLYRENIGQERMISDAVRGGWLFFYVEPTPASARTVEMFLRVWGSYRSVPELGVRNSTSLPAQGTNVLYDVSNVFAGPGTVTANAKIGVGRARARLESTAAGNVTMLIEYGSVVSSLRDTLTLAAAGTTTAELILPTRQARVSLTASAAMTVRASIIQDRRVQ